MGHMTYRPKVVLSAGFSGALQQDYHVGDVIVATEVVDLEGHRWKATWPGELPPGEWRPALRQGRLLSVPRLLTTSEEKQNLGRQYAASAADMETAAVAEICQRHGVPFGCVRVISDDIHTPLSPQLVGLLTEGRVSPLRVGSALLKSPRLAGELWRLGRQTRFAARQLAQALGELLTLTLA
jgi:hypothetical protein